MLQIDLLKNTDTGYDLIKTFTTDPGHKKLLQTETNIVYYDEVIDVIVGYNEDGTPIAKYTYKEIDKTLNDYELEARV